MSRDKDLDLDAILAEFHGQEAAARPVNRPEPLKAPSRRALREEAERQAAAEKTAPSEEKTVLFETLPQEKPLQQQSVPAPAAKKQPAEAETQREVSAAPIRERAEKREKAPVRPRAQGKKEQRPGKAFALMFLVLMLLAAALAGLMRWSRLAEAAARPQPPEEIRLSLGEDLEALLDEEAASSR